MDTGSFQKLINTVIDERYRVMEKLGVGGMAYVLKARDLKEDRDVAIKVLNDEFKSDERAVKRFINESKTVSMLSHDNIVNIYDVVLKEDMKYIVMEYIDGITLKDYIDNVGALSWKEATHYIKQVLSALTHAHEKQVIHRDIKPQNMMLLPDGKIKVTDFGIAKQPNAESITMTDKAIGTVNYISPEQASGVKVDSRTDIYSVGVMLYEMVTGRLPFIAESPVAVAMMQVSNEPIAPREINAQIPVGLEQIILKSMQKNPDDRFASAAAMLKAIEYFAANPTVVFASSISGTGASGAKVKDTEEEQNKLKKYIRGSRSMFPIISGIAASFAVVAIIFVLIWALPFFKGVSSTEEALESGLPSMINTLLGIKDTSDSQKINVSSFVGEKYDDVLVAGMESLGYTVEKVTYVRNPGYGSNVVVKQEPEADSIRLKPDDGKLIPITLYVNMGEEEMEMPDCTLLHMSDAKRVVRSEVNSVSVNEISADDIKVVYEYHDTYPADYVIRTEPALKEVITLSDAPVFTLYVSKGRKISNTTVPELEGLTLDEAKRSIVSSKLALGRIYYEESVSVKSGEVIKASHTKGEVVASGITSVDLWVSTGSAFAVPEDTTPKVQTPAQNTEQNKPEPKPEVAENDGKTGEENHTVEDIAGLLEMRNSQDE